MKVLQINCVWNAGSTGRIVANIHNGLKKNGHESIVCYGRGQNQPHNAVHKVSSELEAKMHSALSRLFGVQFAFSPIATKRTITLIRKENPDIVHLHCLNGNFLNVYKVLDYLKKNSIKTVLTLHAEIMHTAGCEHANDCEKWKTQCNHCERIQGKVSRYFRDDARYCFEKMKCSFWGFSHLTIVGVSSWLTGRAEKSGIFANCDAVFETVYNGLDVNSFTYLVPKKENSLENGNPKILHVTPNFKHPIKGGEYVLQLARRNPHWDFCIVGPGGDGMEWPSNVKYIGRINDDEELRRYYSCADITLLTSSRETFSMVCAESLCCGTPVVGFKAGGPEEISLPEFSCFVNYGNVDMLEDAVRQMLACPKDRERCSALAKDRYSEYKMVDEYIRIYKEL